MGPSVPGEATLSKEAATRAAAARSAPGARRPRRRERLMGWDGIEEDGDTGGGRGTSGRDNGRASRAPRRCRGRKKIPP